MKVLFFFVALLSIITNFSKEEVSSQSENKKENVNARYNTSDQKLSEFKTFSRKFFTAVVQHDTTFLKAHVNFPIKNSAFYILDKKLKENQNVGKEYFLKHLDTLFSKDFLKRIGKEAKYSISPGEDYIVELYSDSGGVESNLTWIFIRKNNKFFFETYQAEAG